MKNALFDWFMLNVMPVFAMVILVATIVTMGFAVVDILS